MKDTVNTDQIFEDARQLGKKPYRVAALPELGVTSPAEFVERMETLRAKAVAAFDNCCYIEYLSLLLLYIEVWLRIYLVGKGQGEGLNIYTDRLFFGELIRKCANAGMDQAMVDELRFFNGWRKDYVHSYLKKSFDYSELMKHRPRLAKIPLDLPLYVAHATGRVVNSPGEIGSPGDIVILL